LHHHNFADTNYLLTVTNSKNGTPYCCSSKCFIEFNFVCATAQKRFGIRIEELWMSVGTVRDLLMKFLRGNLTVPACSYGFHR
jgi:hypothetical protein